ATIPAAATKAQDRTPCDIARHSTESRGIEPSFSRPLIRGKAAIGNAVGPDRRASRVQIASRDRERESGAKRENTIGLPSFQKNGRDPVQALAKRHFVDKVENARLGLIERIASLGTAAIPR